MNAAFQHKTHRNLPRPDFEQVALVLQGGGALGAYQAGVYQALEEAGLGMDWIAGVSIGAINGALIAGNAPERRVERMKQFWDEVSAEPLPLAWPLSWLDSLPAEVTRTTALRNALNGMSALTAAVWGVPAMFTPRLAAPWSWLPGVGGPISVYDTAPMKATLERLVDFDRINTGPIRFSVGAVNVRSGNFSYFDTTKDVIRADHVMASAALPPGFAPVEIDGEFYWDGGLVSNTPLHWVVESGPTRDTLVFQVDLWNARGDLPENLPEVATRQKEIQYSSRTRASTDSLRQIQRLKNAAAEALAALPPELAGHEAVRRLGELTQRKAFSIVHLIYHARPHQGSTKDVEFSRLNVAEHWTAGYDDAVRTLRRPEATARPDLAECDGVTTFDISRFEGRR